MIIWYILLLAIGFLALVKGADIFVDGSSGLARRFRISGLVIGLTIVSMGTSAPELAVSTIAAAQGSNEIAFSNVVGSNIFNLLAILGVCAVIKPLPVDSLILKRDFPVSIAASVLLLICSAGKNLFSGILGTFSMSENAGLVTRAAGIIMLTAFVVYIIFLIRNSKKEESSDGNEKMPLWKSILMILIGLALTVAGAQAVVFGAKKLALLGGMTETFIGVTIVAAGTSLPELVTSIVAAKKGETALAVGNVLGSNIFNLLFILGISAVIHPLSVNAASVYDLILLIVFSAAGYLFSITKRRIGRIEGVVMLGLYVGDVIYAMNIQGR